MSDATPTPPPSAPDRGMRWVLLLIAVSLLWYLLADRYTPYTQQARLQLTWSRWPPKWPGRSSVWP